MLQAEKQHSGKKILINVRLMLHPSERSSEAQLVNFWRKYGDTVTREYVKQLQCFDTQTEVYVPLQSKTRATPICIKPGFLLNVFWNGDVPLCGDMCLLRDSPNALLGNINGNSILEMWNMPLLQQLREGHRCGDEIEMCRGCHGQ
ncbi:MAG: hypothetical protein A2075_12860 [Geobacteraceae bacterium GWC2_58_44]|nr:MAG: hypothetical protein A2075_12860 [Geobacteraceae bacterium GWC2_58_44]